MLFIGTQLKGGLSWSGPSPPIEVHYALFKLGHIHEWTFHVAENNVAFWRDASKQNDKTATAP